MTALHTTAHHGPRTQAEHQAYMTGSQCHTYYNRNATYTTRTCHCTHAMASGRHTHGVRIQHHLYSTPYSSARAPHRTLAETAGASGSALARALHVAASKVATASTPHATASQGGRSAPAHTDAVLGPHRVESMKDASLRVAVSTCTVAQHQGAAPEVHRRGIRSTSHLGRPMRPTTSQPRDLRPAQKLHRCGDGSLSAAAAWRRAH